MNVSNVIYLTIMMKLIKNVFSVIHHVYLVQDLLVMIVLYVVIRLGVLITLGKIYNINKNVQMYFKLIVMIIVREEI